MKSKTFQDVEVWRKAHAWVLQIYSFSAKFPYDERFGLTSQLRRAPCGCVGSGEFCGRI